MIRRLWNWLREGWDERAPFNGPGDILIQMHIAALRERDRKAAEDAERTGF